jgi:hypothetical protein
MPTVKATVKMMWRGQVVKRGTRFMIPDGEALPDHVALVTGSEPDFIPMTTAPGEAAVVPTGAGHAKNTPLPLSHFARSGAELRGLEKMAADMAMQSAPRAPVPEAARPPEMASDAAPGQPAPVIPAPPLRPPQRPGRRAPSEG